MSPLYLIEKAKRPQRILFAFLFGALGSLAMAPYNVWPAFALSFSVLYLLIYRTRNPGGAFIYGWVFGFGYFFTGLFWVKNALLVDGNPFSWIWPLAVMGLPSLLAFFTAFGALWVKSFTNPKTISGFLAFTAFMATTEWLRSFVFTGFPWNLYGYTWAGTLPIVQTVAVGNIYFLTWLTLFWLTLPGFLILRGSLKKPELVLTAIVLGSFILCFAFGSYRLLTSTVQAVPDVALHIVQPSIPQDEKWDRTKTNQQFTRMVDLSKAAPDDGKKTIIVWPETALNYWLAQDPNAMQYLTTMLGSYSGGAVLLTGMLRFEPQTHSYYNSLVMIDSAGNISNVYDKHHLVPFGEYIPFQKWIPLEPVAKFSGFVLGDGPHTFNALGIKYSPVICYEIIFSGKVAGAEAPDLIVNVTNDAWYGISAGPYQHMVEAQFRAVEEGTPVIRAANTGFSGVIDPLGIIHAESPLFQQYEKTLALPATNMIFRNNILHKNVVFVMLVLLATILAFYKKQKI